MKFLIIDKRKRVGELNTPHYAVTRLVDELKSRNIECDLAYFDNINLITTKGKFEITVSGKPLKDYTHIIMRGHRTKQEFILKKYLVEYSLQNSIKVQNAQFIQMTTFYDKLFQMIIMSENNIPYIDSAYTIDGRYFEKPDLIETIGFPMIYKHIEGAYKIESKDGSNKTKKNVYLANNIEKLKQLCETQDKVKNEFTTRSSKYFIQKFVDIGEDYRALMIGGKYIGGWKRVATKNFITVSDGEYTNYPNPTPEFLELSEKVASLFKADFCAIDIIYSAGKPYVLEINMNPGFKAFETKVEGVQVNVAKLIIEQMLEK